MYFLLFRIISQEVPARAVDDASVPVREAYFALCFWLNIEYLTQLSVSSCFNHVSWFFAERVECSMLLKITLKCLSLRVVLDPLNQVVNVDGVWSFHHRVRHAWDVEVDVLLIDCKVELVRVWWCVALKSMSVRVVLDFLNQISNAGAM